MEIWAAVLGALVAAVAGYLASYLQRRRELRDSAVGGLAVARREDKLQRLQEGEAATKVVVDSYALLHLIGTLRDAGSGVAQPIEEEVHREWLQLRKRIMMLRQLHPSREVRHSTEWLQGKIDESVDSLDGVWMAGGMSQWQRDKLDTARYAVDRLAGSLRNDRGKIDNDWETTEQAPPPLPDEGDGG